MERSLNFKHVHYLIHQEKFSQANQILEDLLLSEPSESMWYFLKLFIAYENRRGQEIDYWYKKITSLFPGTIEANIAESLVPGQRISTAIKSLKHVQRLDIHNPFINYLIGNYYRLDGKYLLAAKYYQRCMELDNRFLLTYHSLLHCLTQIRDVDFINKGLLILFVNEVEIYKSILRTETIKPKKG